MNRAALPRFSVLLPFHYRVTPSHLQAALSSVADLQTLPADQIVVVQDGPVPPPVQECLQRCKDQTALRITHVTLPSNQGLGPALNTGLQACEHDLVARMDADDIALPERFAVQIPLMADGLDVLGSGMYEFGEEADPDCGRRTPLTDPERIVASARFHQTFNHPTVVYRKSLIEHVGGYEPFPHLEDYLLFARLIMAGARVGNVAQPLVRYRIGEGAYARRGGWSILRAEIMLQRRFLAMGFTTPAQCVRNVAVRGGYRLVPEELRKFAYHKLLANRS